MKMKYDVVGLYEHNEISYDKVKEAFKTSDVVGIVQATGTGKSYNALQICYDNQDKKIIYVVPSLGIIEHIKSIIEENPNLSLDKDFIGRDALVKQKEAGLTRKIVGFEMIDRGIARQHYPIYYQGREVGEVTSGVPSPTLNKNIGLGYVEFAVREPDTEIQIKVRDNLVKAKIVKLPFYKSK
jgi:hypothetical protein